MFSIRTVWIFRLAVHKRMGFFRWCAYIMNRKYWAAIILQTIRAPFCNECDVTVPRAWAALEPHLPRVSLSRPAHSSRGSEASTQLAFPNKPRFRAFPRICWPQFHAFPCNGKPQIRAFPRNWKPLFGAFQSLNKARIPTHSHTIKSMVPCILFVQQFGQADIKDNMQVQHHGPFVSRIYSAVPSQRVITAVLERRHMSVMSNQRQLDYSFNNLSSLITKKKKSKLCLSGSLWGVSGDRWITQGKGRQFKKSFRIMRLCILTTH